MAPNDDSPHVTLAVQFPARFDRSQVFLRLCVLAVAGVLHVSLGWLFGVLYLLLPTIAAVMISRKGGAAFRADGARGLARVVEWAVAFYAYLFFVTERLPVDARDVAVHVDLDVQSTTEPTVGGALSRLVTSLPHVLVLAVLGVASGLISMVAAISVLFVQRYPEVLWAFQRDVVLWGARVLVHHASLGDAYPSFELGTSTPPHPS